MELCEVQNKMEGLTKEEQISLFLSNRSYFYKRIPLYALMLAIIGMATFLGFFHMKYPQYD